METETLEKKPMKERPIIFSVTTGQPSQRGRKKGVKTSPVRRVVELRLRRLGAVKTRELAACAS